MTPRIKKTGSRKQAIDAMCKSCIYDSHSSGTWRSQVKACTSYDCPLYSFRPLPVTTHEKA